jgi:hypothetical protein
MKKMVAGAAAAMVSGHTGFGRDARNDPRDAGATAVKAGQTKSRFIKVAKVLPDGHRGGKNRGRSAFAKASSFAKASTSAEAMVDGMEDGTAGQGGEDEEE